MERPGEHTVPAGPLAVRWRGWAFGKFRAGSVTTGRLEFENAGSITWRSDGPSWIHASYHWLDGLGNPIVWDGLRAPLPRPIVPGERVSVDLDVRAPLPPGRYRLAFDLIDAERLWFSELGNVMGETDVDVAPRIERRLLAVDVRPGPDALRQQTFSALAHQGEPLASDATQAEAIAYLAPGCVPTPDWSRRILDAHAEGYAAVGGSVEPLAGFLGRRRIGALLAPWAPGGGRKPGFTGPLLCPSVLRDSKPEWAPDVAGLPALAGAGTEPWVYDGRVRIRARL